MDFTKTKIMLDICYKLLIIINGSKFKVHKILITHVENATVLPLTSGMLSTDVKTLLIHVVKCIFSTSITQSLDVKYS